MRFRPTNIAPNTFETEIEDGELRLFIGAGIMRRPVSIEAALGSGWIEQLPEQAILEVTISDDASEETKRIIRSRIEGYARFIRGFEGVSVTVRRL